MKCYKEMYAIRGYRAGHPWAKKRAQPRKLRPLLLHCNSDNKKEKKTIKKGGD